MFPAFSNFMLEEELGSGTFAIVYKAIWRNQRIAVKKFALKGHDTVIDSEVRQMARIRHPNIIRIYGMDICLQHIFMEYADCGTLHDFLHTKIQLKYALLNALNWALQCAKGVAYLHSMTPKPLIHRDLKPLNLLLVNKMHVIKICDFGTAVDKSTMMTNSRGSAAWMAPEVFEGSKYTEKCDIFSWGIILWELLSRKQPFKEIENAYCVMWRIHKGDRPPLLEKCPVAIEELMESCWSNKPEHRPSMKYIISCLNNLIETRPVAEQMNKQVSRSIDSVTDDILIEGKNSIYSCTSGVYGMEKRKISHINCTQEKLHQQGSRSIYLWRSIIDSLDYELRPGNPHFNKNKSAYIFREHNFLAQEYLKIDTFLCYRQARKRFINDMQATREQVLKTEFMTLHKFKTELWDIYRKSKHQLVELKKKK